MRTGRDVRSAMGRAGILLTLLLGGCTAVLGLDAPKLAPCQDGGCGDSTVADDSAPGGDADAGPLETGVDSGADAADSAPTCDNAAADAVAALSAVQCGGGCFPVVYCTGSTPVCCQTTTGGVTTYACTASETSCTGYPIACANDDNCPGTEICCHFNTKITCDTTANCQTNELVCRPTVTADCPAGKACNVPITIDGVTSPYL